MQSFQCPGLAGRRPCRFLAIRPYAFKTFWPWLVREFQNLLILTLSILRSLISVQNSKFSNVLSWQVADHLDFWPYVLMFLRLFWPWLVQVFQNLLILTLDIFEGQDFWQKYKFGMMSESGLCHTVGFWAIRPYVFSFVGGGVEVRGL